MTSTLEVAEALQARCSRDYYVCLAGAQPELCPPAWGQCTAACSISARHGS